LMIAAAVGGAGGVDNLVVFFFVGLAVHFLVS
jgi:hypothetical protein